MSIPENSNGVPLDLVQDASDEIVGYQPKGYSNLGEKFLVCPSCDKKLVSLVLVKKNGSPEQVFRAKHVKCGVQSFKVSITGYKVIGQACPPFSIIDMDSSIDSNYSEFIVK